LIPRFDDAFSLQITEEPAGYQPSPIAGRAEILLLAIEFARCITLRRRRLPSLRIIAAISGRRHEIARELIVACIFRPVISRENACGCITAAEQ